MFVLTIDENDISCAVMMMGTLVYGIRYTIPEYICTLLVAGGVSTFALLKVRIVLDEKTLLLFA